MRFFLFDKIIEFEKNRSCVGLKSVSYSEDFFSNHYDRCPIMPESLVLESIVQVGSWATVASIDFEALSIVLSVENFKNYEHVKAGETLRLEVVISSNNNHRSQVSGVAKVGEAVVAKAENIVYNYLKYPGFSKEFEREFNLYRSGDDSILDNRWYQLL